MPPVSEGSPSASGPTWVRPALTVVSIVIAGAAIAVLWWKLVDPLGDPWRVLGTAWATFLAFVIGSGIFATLLKAAGALVLVLFRPAGAKTPGDAVKAIEPGLWAWIIRVLDSHIAVWTTVVLTAVALLVFVTVPSPVRSLGPVRPSPLDLRGYEPITANARADFHSAVSGSDVDDDPSADARLLMVQQDVARFAVALGYFNTYGGRSVRLMLAEPGVKIRAAVVATMNRSGIAGAPQLRVDETGRDDDQQAVVAECLPRALRLEVLIMHQRLCEQPPCTPGPIPARLVAIVDQTKGAACP